MTSPLTPNKLLWQLVQPYRGRVLLGAFITLGTTAAMLAIPQVLKRMFDHALLVGDRHALAGMAGIMVGLTVILVLGILARGQLLNYTGVRVANDLRQKLLGHLLTLDVDWFELRVGGELVSRMTGDIQSLRDFVSFSMPMMVRGIFLGVGALLALLYTSPMLTGVLLAAGIPLVLVSSAMGRKVKVLSRKQQDRFAKFAGALGEQVAQPITIRAYGQQATMREKAEGLLGDILKAARQMIVANNILFGTNMAVGFLALTGVVWLGGLQVMDGHMSLGDMTAFLLYLGFLGDAVGNLGNFWPAWQTVLGGLERVGEIIATPPHIVNPARPQKLPVAKGGRTIVFDKATYAYPARPEEKVLKGISMTLPRGKRVALVGPSGAGKSTLLRLMLRLADVGNGSVKLDGVDVRKLAVGDLRQQFALVAQDAPLFSGSVRDNVAFGKPNADEKEVWRALKIAHADGFVKELPQGLKTAVGERGVQLSGGQRQRIAIARAVLVDAPVLLLDEATSHLDTDSERAVQAALEDAGKGRTVVAIAHRLSTVRDADLIVVLDKGAVVASGTHAQLMKRSKLYAGLAALQLRQ
ncbi:MAG TPA: ABC transporter transmembrane domain-containing protein [Alphaproteobacteria bacterium]|nr:ABC transporter transmembrane domain-containing protein [Alphaproteobacteria bacterium]